MATSAPLGSIKVGKPTRVGIPLIQSPVMGFIGILLTTLAFESRAAYAAAPSPNVKSFTADASAVTYEGGVVVLTGSATNADSCTLSVTPAIKSMAYGVNCSAFSVPVSLPAATKASAIVYKFKLSLSGAGGKASTTSNVAVPGYPKPVIGAFYPSIRRFDATGGATQLAGFARFATSCTLSVKPSIKGMPSSVDCAHFDTAATFPSTTKAASTTYSFTLTAKGPGGTTAATSSTTVAGYPKPQINTFEPSPTSMTLSGGNVGVSVAADFAKSCTLSIAPAIKGLPLKVPCAGAGANFNVPSFLSPVTYTLTYTATGPSGTTVATRALGVGVRPHIDSLDAFPASLPGSGGQVWLNAATSLATDCSLSVTPAIADLPASVDCENGASAIVIPPNTSHEPLSYVLVMTASGPGGITQKSVALTVAPQAVKDSRVRAITSGFDFTCAALLDGRIDCWGSHESGQLGNGSTDKVGAPAPVAGITTAINVSAGFQHTCALLSGSRIACWGYNGSNQLGTGGADGVATTPLLVSGITSATAIAAGDGHTCALLSSGQVACWGDNSGGQLGNGTLKSSEAPVLVSGITAATSITAGQNYTCALLSSGQVACWGANWSGQLGNGTNAESTEPTFALGITSATSITAGWSHTCALLASGRVACWGRGQESQLGNGAITDSKEPQQVSGVASATSVSARNAHTCVTLSTGNIACWGSNGSGQLGDGTTSDSATPVLVSGIANATATAPGGGHTCALLDTGEVGCWGDNSSGQLGDGVAISTVPVIASTVPNAKSVSAGNAHTCALLSSGRVPCWGANWSGQLGDGATVAAAISAGYAHTCVLLSNSHVACWGDNYFGELGDGTGDIGQQSRSPREVAGITTAAAVSAGASHTCALLNTGEVNCWGSNWSGELGSGNLMWSKVPVRVVNLTAATAITSGRSHSCALLATAEIACWGSNRYGQLGALTSYSVSPTLVSRVTNATAVSAGDGHTCALLATGEVTCWGAGGDQALDGASAADFAAPKLVAGISSAIAISAGSSFTCAVLATRAVTCWGANHSGNLGNGTTNDSATPTAVLGISTAISISAGNSHACAVLTTGEVTCWGANRVGQLDNRYATPVMVVGIGRP